MFENNMLDSMRSERGSALIYILIAVALLAALTVSLMEPSGQQAQSQNATNVFTEVDSQIGFITSAISECVLTHPDQDSELTATEQQNAPYPINPSDPYFDNQSADPLSDPDDSVQYIRCPGNPGGSGPNNQDHARIFGELRESSCLRHRLYSEIGNIITAQTELRLQFPVPRPILILKAHYSVWMTNFPDVKPRLLTVDRPVHCPLRPIPRPGRQAPENVQAGRFVSAIG